MKKMIFIMIGLLTAIFQRTIAQVPYVVIYQPKVIDQVFVNGLTREGHIGLLKSSLKNTKEYKQKTLAAWTAVTTINKKIYTNLTNASDGIKNGEMMVSIAKKIPQIIKNVTEAGKIAADKPYLITIWNQTGQMLVDRSLRLYGDINAIVLTTNKEMLINQAKRDEMLWRIYSQISTIDNISKRMIYEFKYYNLQMAINGIFPYKFYFDLDKSIVRQTLNKFKF